MTKNDDSSADASRIATRSDIERAADIIQAGGLVALPTETVYGLAADATSDSAVARIFEAKTRPQFNPLIVHVADAKMARRFVDWPALAEKLAAAFWPGPLTLVLPRRTKCAISLLASAGLETLGLRAPDHKIAQSLIHAADRPLAAPSANASGTISPTTADHVRASLGDKVDMILDGGPCTVGLESTIVKIDGNDVFMLRAGGTPSEDIEAVIEMRLMQPAKNAKPEAPGMLTSHYAPRASMRLNVAAPNANEAFLAFGGGAVELPHSLNLSETGNLREAAANLFAHLHALDELCTRQTLQGIAVAPLPNIGLGEAINDRLTRAAATRD